MDGAMRLTRCSYLYVVVLLYKICVGAQRIAVITCVAHCALPFSIMACATQYVKNLSHMAALAQSQIGAGADVSETAVEMYESLLFKTKQLRNLNFEDATSVLDAIRDNASSFGWDADQRKNLIVTVNTKLKMPDDSGPRSTQECVTFPWYYTATEVELISGCRYSDRAMVNVSKKRAKAIGLHCASEKTKGHIAMCIRQLSGRSDMDTAAFAVLLAEVRTAFQDLKKCAWPHAWISIYPDDPRLLPADVLVAAYGDDVPAMHDIEGGHQDPEFLRKSHGKHPKKQVHNVVIPDQNGMDLTKIMGMFGQSIRSAMKSDNGWKHTESWAHTDWRSNAGWDWHSHGGWNGSSSGSGGSDWQTTDKWSLRYVPSVPALADGTVDDDGSAHWDARGAFGPPKRSAPPPPHDDTPDAASIEDGDTPDAAVAEEAPDFSDDELVLKQSMDAVKSDKKTQAVHDKKARAEAELARANKTLAAMATKACKATNAAKTVHEHAEFLLSKKRRIIGKGGKPEGGDRCANWRCASCGSDCCCEGGRDAEEEGEGADPAAIGHHGRSCADTCTTRRRRRRCAEGRCPHPQRRSYLYELEKEAIPCGAQQPYQPKR